MYYYFEETFARFKSHFPHLARHAFYANQSVFTQERLRSFSQGLCRFSVMPEFYPASQADKKYEERVRDAAFSRTRPVQDAANFWQLMGARGSTDTESGGPAPKSTSAMLELMKEELYVITIFHEPI
jgi:hypothetical protein